MDQERHDAPITFAPPRTSRRAIVLWTAKLAGGMAVAAVPGTRWVQLAAAQDEGVTLTTPAGAQVSARPGAALARSRVAEAMAERGFARAQAAAALAAADEEDGAIAQGAAAFATADPDQGAVAQSAIAVATASSDGEEDLAPKAAPKVAAPAVAPVRAGRMGGRVRGGGRGRGAGRAIRAGRGGARVRRRDRVGRLPSAGIGFDQPGALPSLFAAASGLAALGAIALRNRGGLVGLHVVTADDGAGPAV